ncbi:MAG: DUF433 domain-containing protein [bacterium]|nr:DUF433 domain-containing protein [bacterium]
MSLTIGKEKVPLKVDSHGVARIGGTRVTLETVVITFKEGATAEEIVYRYPTLKLADVYSVLSYYLRRKEDVEEYLNQRQQVTEQVRQLNEARFDPDGIRDRLLARQVKTG